MDSGKSHRSNAAAILGLAFVAILSLLPAGINLLISFVDYTPAKGMFGSPFVGLNNYQSVFTGQFPRLLGNSFLLWLASFLAAFILGLAAALLCSLIKNTRLAAACAGLFLLPAFIPAISYFILVSKIFTTQIFTSNSSYALGFVAQTILPGAAFIAFAGAALGLIWRTRGRNPFSATLQGCLGAALLVCFMSLMPSFEALQLSYNPLVYQSADILDTFIYRSALMQMKLGSGAAAFVLRSVLQVILAIIPAVILVAWLRKRDALELADVIPEMESIPGKRFLNWLPWLAAILFSLAVWLFVGFPKIGAVKTITDNLVMAIPTVIIASMIGLAITAIILSSARSASRTVLVIFAVILLSPANALVGQYLLARQFGLINTVLPTGLSAWLLPQALLLILIFALLLNNNHSQKAALFFSLSAACLIGALAYGYIFPNILFANRNDLLTPGSLLRNVFSSAAAANKDALSLLYGITLLPCLLVGFAGAAFARKGLLELPK